jgi:hypothetical protein
VEDGRSTLFIPTHLLALGHPLGNNPLPPEVAQLQTASCGDVVLEEAAAADVLADLLQRAVAGLFHDGALGGAAFGN